MIKEFNVKVEDVREGRLKGQLIAEATYGDGKVVFDLVSDLVDVKPGEELILEIRDTQPDNLDSYKFCGHGFLAASESQNRKTLLSVWGLLFMFEPSIGLEENKKYYVCISSRK